MAELFDLNSWKSFPTRCIACIEGASAGLIDTAWASPTFSSGGTNTFTTTVSPSQKSSIGTEARRSVCASHGCANG